MRVFRNGLTVFLRKAAEPGRQGRHLSRKALLMGSLALGFFSGAVAANTLVSIDATSSNATVGVMNLSVSRLSSSSLSNPSALSAGTN